MQLFRPQDLTDQQAREQDKFLLLFLRTYSGGGNREIQNKMDELKKQAEGDGFVEVMRTKDVGRNSACPCGSRKKFKQCCIKKAQYI